MRDAAGDPHGAVGWDDPQVVLRATDNGAVKRDNQLPLTVGVDRHFRGVINEIKLPGDRWRSCGVRVKECGGVLGRHRIGSI
jgi:hypothetical protein